MSKVHRYTNFSAYPIVYYDWDCPLCGDRCSDPQSIDITECHNHHEVSLTLCDDTTATFMVATLTKPADIAALKEKRANA